MNHDVLLHFAKQIFVDQLVCPDEAIQPGDWLTLADDGSGSVLCGKQYQVERVSIEGVYLKGSNGAFCEPAHCLHFPLQPATWTSHQRKVIADLYKSKLRNFILATESGFIGARGILEYPETYKILSVFYAGKFCWRPTAAAAAEDFRLIDVLQPEFEIVVRMPSKIQRAALADTASNWEAIGTRIISHN